MEFRSLKDLGRTVAEWSALLPPELDLIVGVPRSGMLVATLLALHMHKPLVDLEGYLQGRSFAGGDRTGLSRASVDAPLRVLVVDDSVNEGTAMRRARSAVESAQENQRIEANDEVTFGAAYVTASGRDLVDTYGEVVAIPRVFEWNIMHHDTLLEACMDIDGVLCRDPTAEENDDGPQYRSFLSSVPPKVIPRIRIAHLVSARTEDYRAATEEWLARHNIKYGELHLYQGTAAERQARGDHARHKADIYHRTSARIFIESDVSQAATINQLTHRAVLATDTMQYFGERGVHRAITSLRASERLPARLARRVKRALRIATPRHSSEP